VTTHELTALALLAAAGAALFLWRPPAPGGAQARKHLLRGGLIVGLADLVVELVGTHTGGWHYNKSLFFITGTVPVELLVLFFSSGVWLAGFHLIIHKDLRFPKTEHLLLVLVALGAALYGLAIARDQEINMILFTLPFGFWGLLRIDKPSARSAAVLLAASTALCDWIIETWAVGSGNYAYQAGFTIETPLTYAMLVLGFLGMLEKRIPKA
jgi:hypothetical protein